MSEDTVVRVARERSTDKGFWCSLALRFSEAWDFIDARDIDKHALSLSVFGMTVYIVYWCMEFIWTHPDKPGLEVAAMVAAIMVPWNGVQAAAIKWYFEARTE